MLKRILAVLTAAALIAIGLGAAPAYAAGPYYYYAGAAQTITTTTLAANLEVDNPYVDTNDNEHSITELSVQRGTNSGTAWQVIEVGWGVNHLATGDTNTRLWTGAWKNGSFLGYNSGGFVSWCSTSPCTSKQANDILVASGGSALASKGFTIQYMSTGTTGWWVGYDGQWFGYWPSSIWSSANGGAFVSGDRVDIFGEIAAWWTTSPCSDMGVNYLPTGTTGAFAGSTTVNGTSSGVSLTAHASDSTHYNAVMATGSTRSFRYGGDGYC